MAMIELTSMTYLLLAIALISGFYMAWNIGANDVANAIGTSVGSGALTLRRAVILAAIFEFVGAYFFGADVAETMSHGIIHIELFQNEPLRLALGMISALLATGLWLQVASYFGWPVSTTHSIVGAIAGFGLYSFGQDALIWEKLVQIATSWLISPLVGGILSFTLFSGLRRHIFFKARPLEAVQKLAPLIISSFVTVMASLFLFNLTPDERVSTLVLEMLFLLLCIASVAYLLTILLMPYFIDQEETTTLQLSALSAHKLTGAIASLNQVRLQISATATEASLSCRTLEATQDPALVEEAHLLEARIDQLKAMSEQTLNSSLQSAQIHKVEGFFACLQCVSACFMALSHGANDVSNAVGPLSVAITILYQAVVPVAAPIPGWILALGGLGIIVGLATWGWRVVETVGKKITQLTPSRGFSAEFGCASTVLVCSELGLPVSTTHVLVGSILGVGLARGIGALNLSTLRDIGLSWLITLPMGALLSMGVAFCFEKLFL